MSKDSMQQKIQEDPDFINYPKYQNSLSEFLRQKPNGTDDMSLIAKTLMISQEEAEELYNSALEKIRDNLNIEVEDE